LSVADLEPLWRILIAAGLTLPVGLERELRGKAAGLRTHVVVSIASAALGYISITAAGDSQGNDATRIAAQVVSGIGFMGAGVIFASSGRVHGLTTAAALWSAMAIGLCAGMGGYGIAAALVVVTLIFLAPVDALSARMVTAYGWEERTFHLVAEDLPAVTRAQHAIVAIGASLREIELEPLGEHISARLLVRCRGSAVNEIYRTVAAVDGISFVSNEALQRGEG
jgi:putative Mg2+ transporter-C (MgtC) family protein